MTARRGGSAHLRYLGFPLLDTILLIPLLLQPVHLFNLVQDLLSLTGLVGLHEVYLGGCVPLLLLEDQADVEVRLLYHLRLSLCQEEALQCILEVEHGCIVLAKLFTAACCVVVDQRVDCLLLRGQLFNQGGELRQCFCVLSLVEKRVCFVQTHS